MVVLQPKKQRNRAFGAAGEKLALEFLRQKDYVIKARNWRCQKPRGEIDLIATKDGVLIFVEVKTISPSNFALPEDHFTTTKMRQISRLAFAYLNQVLKSQATPFQIDLIAIIINDNLERPEIRHYPNVVSDTY